MTRRTNQSTQRCRRARKPTLTEKLVLKWADDHRRRTGAWPRTRSGRVMGERHQSWITVDGSLRQGTRGLAGGSSLFRLLARHCGVPNPYKPRLTVAEVLRWCGEFWRRTGRWPTTQSGRVRDADGESWSGVMTALSRGLRGLPGGQSLAELGRQRGIPLSRNDRKTLTTSQVLEWADAHFVQTGSWPSGASGRVLGSTLWTWRTIDHALLAGSHGLPRGQSLADIIGYREGPLRHLRERSLSLAMVLRWADDQHRRTGRWPHKDSGPIKAVRAISWGAIDWSLRRGRFGLPGGKNLAHTLAEHRHTGQKLQDRSVLTLKQILAWADAHHARTGQWPHSTSGKIAGVDLTWRGVKSLLQTGGRRLPKDWTLASLLEARRGYVNPNDRPKLSERQILLWARAYHRRHGEWPTAYSGKVQDARGEVWRNIDAAMRRGNRGLTRVSSLARFLKYRRRPDVLVSAYRVR